jgi:hypothetical protein
MAEKKQGSELSCHVLFVPLDMESLSPNGQHWMFVGHVGHVLDEENDNDYEDDAVDEDDDNDDDMIFFQFWKIFQFLKELAEKYKFLFHAWSDPGDIPIHIKSGNPVSNTWTLVFSSTSTSQRTADIIVVHFLQEMAKDNAALDVPEEPDVEVNEEEPQTSGISFFTAAR